MTNVDSPSRAASGELEQHIRSGKLLIVIPALNEEDSIASTIERCLAAAPEIVEATGVQQVDITVVSDGSTDGTVEIASRYLDRIDLIIFELNKGYGAAIKEAWRRSDADLLGFLDADGTCDPAFFVPLCNAVLVDEVDVALGCRLNRDSKMPMLRRLGNTMFAILLSALASSRVRDTASGMRVVRRSRAPRPLPIAERLALHPSDECAGDAVEGTAAGRARHAVPRA